MSPDVDFPPAPPPSDYESDQVGTAAAAKDLSEAWHAIVDPPLLAIMRWLNRQIRRWP